MQCRRNLRRAAFIQDLSAILPAEQLLRTVHTRIAIHGSCPQRVFNHTKTQLLLDILFPFRRAALLWLRSIISNIINLDGPSDQLKVQES